MAERETFVGARRISIGRIALDCERQVVLLDGQSVSLRPQSFKVLRILVERRDQLVSRDRLLEEVWRDRIVTDDSLVQCLVDIRKVLSAIDSEVVKTLPGRGYIFQSERVNNVSRVPVAYIRRFRWGFAVASILLVVLTSQLLSLKPDPDTLVNRSSEISIAVLPFADMTEAQDKRFLAEGLAEEVLNQLAASGALKVISRTSSFSVQADHANMEAIATRLGVSHVLEGSIRQGDDRLRISVQLINTSDDSRQWSRSYDRPLSDILAIQSDIAMSVASSLNTTLRQPENGGHSGNPYAHALLIQARSELRLRDSRSAAHAERLLRRALELDPRNASILAALAIAVRRVEFRNDADARRAGWERSIVLTERALELDPGHPVALAQRGWIDLYYHKDYPSAARSIETATRIDPGNPEVIRLATNASLVFDQPETAVRLGQHILQRDPLCLPCQTFLVVTASKAGNLELAELTARRLLELNPDFPAAYTLLADVYLEKGDPEAALLILDQHPDSSAGSLITRAVAYYQMGNLQDFAEARQQMIDLYGDQYPTFVAQLDAIAGNIDSAFAWLDKQMAKPRWSREVNYLSENFVNLHDDPRWNRYLEKFGLSPIQVAQIDFSPTLPL